MTPSETSHERWDRLKRELADCRATELEMWGGIDDLLLARYLSAECSTDEIAKVEDAAKRFSAVKQAIELIGLALAGEAAIDVPTIGETSAVPMDQEIVAADENESNSKIGESIKATRLGAKTTVSNPVQQRWPFAVAAVCFLSTVTMAFELWRTKSENRQLATELKKVIGTKEDRETQILVPTGGQLGGQLNWKSFLSVFYDPNLSDEENLRTLEKQGGKQVAAKISQLRNVNPKATANELLRSLFQEWGGPEADKQ